MENENITKEPHVTVVKTKPKAVQKPIKIKKIDSSLQNSGVVNVVAKNTTKKQIKISEKADNSKRRKTLKVMFLGGVGEIGKNMMALEYGEDIIVIDCGATFPYGEDMLGIDLVVPNIEYLIKNKSRVRGILITHGHEDHIGAVPYVVKDINVPIYGSRLALALIQNKLNEFKNLKPKLITVKEGQNVKLGCFNIEFIHVCHSIAGSMAMAIKTPVGMVVHTGDFKLDFTPIDGKLTNLQRFAELGKQGVLLFMCESTNVEKEGVSMSESQVGKTLDELFKKNASKRIIVSTFASNIHRLQQLLNLAEKYGRKVTFTGRSMVNVTETAYKIGELKFNRDIFIDIDRINHYKDEEVLVISTGSQGEPLSALSRMSTGDFQKVKLGENDCVIISASPIPGNEKMCYNVINNLYKLGCTVVYSSLADVHTSGHAKRDELKVVHSLIKPKYFIPVHGEYRHQIIHKELAVSMGVEERNVILAEIGSRIELDHRAIKITGRIPAGQQLVDGFGYGELQSPVLRDRKQLAEDGVAVVVMTVDRQTQEIVDGPDIISRGLVYSNEAEDLIKEAKLEIRDMVKRYNLIDVAVLRDDIRRFVANFFYKKTKRRPMVLAVIYED